MNGRSVATHSTMANCVPSAISLLISSQQPTYSGRFSICGQSKITSPSYLLLPPRLSELKEPPYQYCASGAS